MSWSDDFNRADGRVGVNWHETYLTLSISGGVLKLASAASGHCQVVSEAGRHDASITFANSVAADIGNRICVKFSDSSNAYYGAWLTGTSGNYNAIIQMVSGTPVQLASNPFAGSLGATVTYRLTYDQGQLFFYVNGIQRAWAAESTLDANTRMGLALGNGITGITRFDIATIPSVGFSVNPAAALAGGPPITISMSGTGTAWSSGAPGTPTFTVSAGAISGQVVTSNTTATAQFTPPADVGSVIVTDPSTGLTDTIWINTTGDIGGGGSGVTCNLSPQAVAMINNTAGESWLETLTKPSSPISVSGGATLELDTVLGRIGLTTSATVNPESPPQSDLLGYLWILLNGGYDPTIGPYLPPSFATTDAGLTIIRDLLNNLTSNDTVSLLAAIAAIKGSPGKTLQEVYDHAGGGGGTDIQPVLDKLALIQPGAGPSLDDLASLIQELSTIAGYTLGDVMGHLRDIRTPANYTFASVLNYLNEMRGNETVTLAQIEQWCVENAMDLTNLQTFLNSHLLPTQANTNTIIELVTALANATAAAFGQVHLPPVWPGEEYATVKESYYLADQLTIEGPMRGVIIDIERTDPGTGFFDYDEERCWRNIGALSFYADGGYHETYQALGFHRAIYVPKTMEMASGVRFHLGRGPVAWVAPWIYKADPGGRD